jgi:hypothetical protein
MTLLLDRSGYFSQLFPEGMARITVQIAFAGSRAMIGREIIAR